MLFFKYGRNNENIKAAKCFGNFHPVSVYHLPRRLALAMFEYVVTIYTFVCMHEGAHAYTLTTFSQYLQESAMAPRQKKHKSHSFSISLNFCMWLCGPVSPRSQLPSTPSFSCFFPFSELPLFPPVNYSKRMPIIPPSCWLKTKPPLDKTTAVCEHNLHKTMTDTNICPGTVQMS